MRLWTTAVRRRPVIFVLLLLVSVAAVALAVAAPLLIRAVEQSSTTNALTRATQADRSVVISANVPDDITSESFAGSARDIIDLRGDIRTVGSADDWNRPLVVFGSTANVAWRVGSKAIISSRYVVPDRTCTGLAVTSGRCPTGKSDVLLSDADLRRVGAQVGSKVRFPQVAARDITLTVAGSYDPDRSATLPLVRPGTDTGTLANISGDSLIVPSAAQGKLGAGLKAYGRIDLRTDVGADAIPAVRSTLAVVNDRLSLQLDAVFTLDTGLPALLDHLEAQWQAARVLILVSALQGAALAIFALIIMAQQLARVRAAEWSIGRLQGVGRLRRWGAIYAETLIPLVLGVPLGLLAARIAAEAVVRRQLVPGTPVELGRTPVLLAAAGAGLAALLAVIVVSVPVLRRPLAELVLQRTESRRLTPFAAVVQSMIIVLALTTGYQLVAGGLLDAAATPLGLLAPSLFALAAAIVAVRLATAAVRLATRRRPRRITGLVVGRRIARTPSALNPSLIVAVAVALAVLASQVLVLSLRNQDLRADATLGADAVLQVTGAATADALVDAVDRADPSGRYAAAVQETAEGSNGGVTRIVAVDTERFPTVTRWRSAWTEVADLGAALRGPTAPALVLRGRTVTLDLTSVSLAPSEPPLSGQAVPPRPEFALTVAEPSGWTVVDLGPLAPRSDGSQQVEGALPSSCRNGCRLISLSVINADDSGYIASFTITSLRTDGLPRATTDEWLRQPQWQSSSAALDPTAPGSAVPTAGPDGLTIRAACEYGNVPQVVRSRAFADPLPVLVAPAVDLQAVPGHPEVATGVGLDGLSQVVTPVGRADVLPRSLGDGVLVDLRTAGALSNPSDSKATSEVWLTADTPPAVIDALGQQGLRVVGRQELPEVRTELRGLPMTRAAAVAAGVGSAALLLALLALLAGRAVDAEQRRSDWAALRRSGLRPGRLRLAAMIEIAAPGLVGVLLGTAAGVVATILSAPQLPLVDLSSAGPPLELAIAVRPTVIIAAVSAAAILVVGVVGAVLETREARR